MLLIESILDVVAYNVPATSSPMLFLEQQYPQTSHYVPNLYTTINKIKFWGGATKLLLVLWISVFAEGNVAPVVSAIATVTVPAAQESMDAVDKSCL